MNPMIFKKKANKNNTVTVFTAQYNNCNNSKKYTTNIEQK